MDNTSYRLHKTDTQFHYNWVKHLLTTVVVSVTYPPSVYEPLEIRNTRTTTKTRVAYGINSPGMRVNTRYVNSTRDSASLHRQEQDVPLVEFMYLVFTRMPGKSYRRRLRSLLLYLCYVFLTLINSFVC